MSGHISVKLFATLSNLTPETSDHYPIEPGVTTVMDIIHALDVPEEDAKLIFINNKKGEKDSVLRDGDRVGIFPPVGGG